MSWHFLIPALRISFETHFLVSLLGCFFWALALILLIVAVSGNGWTNTLLKYVIPREKRKSNPSIKTKTSDKGKVDYAPVWFAALCCAILVYGARHIEASAPIVEEHNVAVLAKVGDEWQMHSDEEGTFMYRPCPDFDNASVIWVGYIADRAKWKEYGRCKSIRDTGLGFWWRDGHDEYRRVQ